MMLFIGILLVGGSILIESGYYNFDIVLWGAFGLTAAMVAISTALNGSDK